MNKLLDDLNCSMFMVKNPETKKTEIIIRFINFNSEQEAIDFAEVFKHENTSEQLLTQYSSTTLH